MAHFHGVEGRRDMAQGTATTRPKNRGGCYPGRHDEEDNQGGPDLAARPCGPTGLLGWLGCDNKNRWGLPSTTNKDSFVGQN
jgi:hypothetical protein